MVIYTQTGETCKNERGILNMQRLKEHLKKAMEKDKDAWEIKEKYFHESVVPHVKSYMRDMEKAKTSAEVKRLKSGLYTYIRASANFLGIKPNELEDRLSDIL